jgi:hypothetical protein
MSGLAGLLSPQTWAHLPGELICGDTWLQQVIPAEGSIPLPLHVGCVLCCLQSRNTVTNSSARAGEALGGR